MRPKSRTLLLFSLLLPCFAAGLGLADPAPSPPPSRLPFREFGLSERAAAAHLLDRFGFGARPGEVDRVVAMGLERWLDRQLAGTFAEAELEKRLAPLRTLALPASEIARLYPNPGLVLRQAAQAGIALPAGGEEGESAEVERRRLGPVLRFAREQGYRPQREMLGELLAQKLLRAVYAENQLQEVLTDFWFNHFYVSLTDNTTRSHVLAYERDAIRPHILGKFRDLLEATARHPAMLLYLDNAQSTANAGVETTLSSRLGAVGRRGPGEGGFGGRRGGGRGRFGGRAGGELGGPRAAPEPEMGSGQERFADSPNRRGPRSRGLNENYARELLELHTLGVDGGYSQQDVVEVARAFTGWTLVPAAREAQLDRRLDRARRAGGLGFVVEGDFLFRADAHDAGSKQVLGTRLPAGRGLEDGEQVLDLVARHLATARHLARKLAIRFVSDEPPGLLVERLAKTFSASGGDLRAVIRALVESPEFWAPEARRAKIKSPFELAASALRATGAEVSDPVETIEWIGRMGQPLYLYQAPTGFPEVAEHWVSTGALLSRMNFGLALAAGRVGGVRLELATLVGEREPESREEALDLLLPLLLPERETAALRPQLAAAVRESGLARKVAERSEQAGGASAMEDYGSLEEDPVFSQLEPGRDSPYGRLFQRHRRAAGVEHEPTAVEQVVGVILGSPEFQRR